MSKPDRAAPVFAALGDPTRLSLLLRLSDGRRLSISALSDGAGMSRQAVAKHLRVLEQAGLVAARREGRESRYAMRPEPVRDARDFLEQVSAGWDEAIERLRAFVED
jgi:DNA-binding transcriptional ArsR family regulator